MTQVAIRPRAKKTVRVAAVVTGVVGTTFLPAAPANASANYQIAVGVPGSVWRMQICGYNQHNNWVCTGNSIPRDTVYPYDYYQSNWWWHGHVRLWWNNHHSHSVNNCWLTSNYRGSKPSYGWIGLDAGYQPSQQWSLC